MKRKIKYVWISTRGSFEQAGRIPHRKICASAADSIRDAGNDIGNDIECLTSRPWDRNKEKVLLPPAVLELVDNDCTNNNATLDNLLPIGRDIHQIKGI